jgi:hypothetical protein
MKSLLLLIGFFMTSVQAQITFFNDSVGAPMGTANQIGRTTYYNDPTGAPLGTANQVGRITYYNDSSGLPLGTAISPKPTQPYYVPQFNNQTIPRVPVAPLYPVRFK